VLFKRETCCDKLQAQHGWCDLHVLLSPCKRMQDLTLVLVGPDLQACTHLMEYMVPQQHPAGLSKADVRDCGVTSVKRSAKSPIQMSSARDVPVCKACSRTRRRMRLLLVASHYQEAMHVTPAADIVFAFHPGFAAQQRQVIETEALWSHQGKGEQSCSHPSALSKTAPKPRRHDWQRSQHRTSAGRNEMRSLRGAWQPVLERLVATTTPFLCTAFSFTGALRVNSRNTSSRPSAILLDLVLAYSCQCLEYLR
jgi:hypothetical protein